MTSSRSAAPSAAPAPAWPCSSGATPRRPSRRHTAACLAHHLRPTAPLAAGPQAAEAGATAMIDLSDGLLRDGDRIARASGVRLALSPAALHPDVDALEPVVGEEAALECVLAGGEEHSLLATFPARSVPGGWRGLGRVVDGEGVTLDGEPQQPRGWDHFHVAAGHSAGQAKGRPPRGEIGLFGMPGGWVSA